MIDIDYMIQFEEKDSRLPENVELYATIVLRLRRLARDKDVAEGKEDLKRHMWHCIYGDISREIRYAIRELDEHNGSGALDILRDLKAKIEKGS